MEERVKVVLRFSMRRSTDVNMRSLFVMFSIGQTIPLPHHLLDSRKKSGEFI